MATYPVGTPRPQGICRHGERMIGYDNERGKGDHRPIAGREEPYDFSTLEILVADFLADIKTKRGEK